ncbi:MAG: membrane protein insertase YidC [Alphaproteobacteria bacterium]|nr:membrane protein insertase YidC [Alphaproteobacteria bacterium]MBN2675490.1 membrane protein insertase YidC [Alphaproteobacteria bacterium]
MVKYLDNKNSGFNNWMAGQQKSGAKPSKSSGFFWWMIIFLLAWWLFSMWTAPKKNIENKIINTTVVENISNVPVSNIMGDKISVDVQGLRVSQIKLKDYKQDKNKDEKISLLSGDKEFAEIGLLASGTVAPTAQTVWKINNGVMTWHNSDKVDFKRTVDVKDYIITIKDEIKNNSGKNVSFAPYARMINNGDTKAVAVATGGIAYVNSDIERNGWKSLDKKSYAYQTTNGFIGFANQYWESIISLNSPDQTILMKKTDTRYQADTSAAPIQVSAGKTAIIETNIFAGPRDQKILSLAAESITGIEKTMDYGWFWFLARPMSWALNALNILVMNYGLAIILLTIALRILMWPLTRKSYTSMAAMQKMQPEMQKVQKLYANDKARLQMEMMKLYQTHKTSPMSGCLPMLLQIPIFFALYKALLISVPMRQAGFLWIGDLSLMDPFYILPLIMGATMWWQQHLQGSVKQKSNNNDPMAQTQKVMKYMPILFTVMFAWMPAGLVLYWTISNLFGIMQMYVIKRSAKK